MESPLAHPYLPHPRRYLILFPLRLIALLVSWILFLPVFFGLELLMPPGRRKDLTQRKLVQARMPTHATVSAAVI